jgi:hypothetical protein
MRRFIARRPDRRGRPRSQHQVDAALRSPQPHFERIKRHYPHFCHEELPLRLLPDIPRKQSAADGAAAARAAAADDPTAAAWVRAADAAADAIAADEAADAAAPPTRVLHIEQIGRIDLDALRAAGIGVPEVRASVAAATGGRPRSVVRIGRPSLRSSLRSSSHLARPAGGAYDGSRSQRPRATVFRARATSPTP